MFNVSNGWTDVQPAMKYAHFPLCGNRAGRGYLRYLFDQLETMGSGPHSATGSIYEKRQIPPPPIFEYSQPALPSCGLCRTHARLKAARRFSSLLNEIALPRSTALLEFSQQSGQSGNPGADFRTPQPRVGLTLDGSGHETAHVVTLQQQEQDQARDGHHHDASLRGAVVDGAHRLLPQVGHRERQGLLCAVG